MPAEKKQILIFLDWYLPGYKAGGPIQSCVNMTEKLKDLYEFSIVTRDTDYMETIPYKSIQYNTWNIFQDGSRVWYLPEEKLGWKTIQKIMKNESFEVLYLNSMFSYFFALIPLVLARRMKNKKIIVAPRGMLGSGALSVKAGKKAVFLSLSRILNIFSGVTFHATSEQEQQDIQNFFGNTVPITLAPNLTGTVSLSPDKKEKQEGVLNLVSLARIAPEKNTGYILRLLEKLIPFADANNKTVKLTLYGPVYNETYWNECREIIRRIQKSIEVNYRNSLEPGKIHTTLAGYDFFILPSRGENFGHAIVQSLQAGTPVIISDKTPWLNLEQQGAGWDIPLEDENKFLSVLKYALEMGPDDYRKLSSTSCDFASRISQNPETEAKYRELFS